LEAPPFRHERDAAFDDLTRRQAADRFTLEADAIGLCLHQAGDGLHESALARTVGADHSHHLAGSEFEVDAEQGLRVTVEGCEAARFQQRTHQASMPM
jgi:hypothetical protein